MVKMKMILCLQKCSHATMEAKSIGVLSTITRLTALPLKTKGQADTILLRAVFLDAGGTPISQHQQTLCDAYGCDQFTDGFSFYGIHQLSLDTDMPIPTNYGNYEFCVSGSVTDTANGAVEMEFSSMCERQIGLGPSLRLVHLDTRQRWT